MKDRSIRTFTRLAALTVALLLLVSCAAAEAVDTKTADPYIELSTQYPAMTVKAGDSLTFALSLDNYSGASQDLTLSVEEIPEGWEGSFSASSNQVSVVHVKNEQTDDSVTFAVDVPLDAADGDYTIRLKAQGQNIADTMDLALTVSAEEIGESSFTAEYPSQEGDADTAFTFSATLINNTLSSQTYSFTANAPTGWQVSFLPSGETTKVAALDVEARTTQAVDISVTPPENIEAGATVETTAYITPGEDAMSGDYVTTLTASSSDASDSAEFRITVKTETKWGLTGIGIIVVLAVVIILVMRKYGRR